MISDVDGQISNSLNLDLTVKLESDLFGEDDADFTQNTRMELIKSPTEKLPQLMKERIEQNTV